MAIWLVLLLLTGFWIIPSIWVLASRARRFPADLSPAQRALAEERSGALLRDLLDETQYAHLMAHGYLDVASPSIERRVYRIPRDAGRVRVYENGRASCELCVQPVVPLPTNDVIVMHKLMIEGDEQGYLARANELPLALPRHFYEQQRWPFLTV